MPWPLCWLRCQASRRPPPAAPGSLYRHGTRLLTNLGPGGFGRPEAGGRKLLVSVLWVEREEPSKPPTTHGVPKIANRIAPG